MSANLGNRTARVVGVLAGLVWLVVLAFLARWFLSWAGGRLEPGSGTSWSALVFLFFAACFLALSGCAWSVWSWIRGSGLGRQIASLAAAVVTLWAVAGD